MIKTGQVSELAASVGSAGVRLIEYVYVGQRHICSVRAGVRVEKLLLPIVCFIVEMRAQIVRQT